VAVPVVDLVKPDGPYILELRVVLHRYHKAPLVGAARSAELPIDELGGLVRGLRENRKGEVAAYLLVVHPALNRLLVLASELAKHDPLATQHRPSPSPDTLFGMLR